MGSLPARHSLPRSTVPLSHPALSCLRSSVAQPSGCVAARTDHGGACTAHRLKPVPLKGSRQSEDNDEMTKTTEANVRMERPLSQVDPQISTLLREEAERQATGLELIPSENLVSEAVLEAMGSIFTNKYAEGYPGKRYYGGCEFADRVEQLAIDRAKQLFG